MFNISGGVGFISSIESSLIVSTSVGNDSRKRCVRGTGRTFDVDPVNLVELHGFVNINDGSDVKDDGRSSTGFSQEVAVPDVTFKHTQLRVASAV